MKLRKNLNWKELFEDLLVILLGITINTPLADFKYLFLLCAIISCIYVLVDAFRQKKLGQFVKLNKLGIALGVYAFILVSVKHLLMYLEKTAGVSIVSGYGEVVYLFLGLLCFSYLPVKKIVLFMNAYTITFSLAFLVEGKKTFYDYGGVFRTIGAYESPNILALFGAVSFFFSVILLLMNKKKVKWLYATTASIAIASIINSTSRSMYLALAISVCAGIVIVILPFVWKEFKRPKFKINFMMVIYFVIMVFALTKIYYPNIEDVVINPQNVALAEDLKNKELLIEKLNESSVYNRVFDEKEVIEDASASTNRRYDIWEVYFDNFSNYFLFGNQEGKDAIFVEQYNVEYNPHNVFLAVLYKYGVFGEILFLIILLIPLIKILKEKRIGLVQAIVVLGMCTIMMYGMLHSAEKWAIFWCVLGMFWNAEKFDVPQMPENRSE